MDGGELKEKAVIRKSYTIIYLPAYLPRTVDDQIQLRCELALVIDEKKWSRTSDVLESRVEFFGLIEYLH